MKRILLASALLICCICLVLTATAIPENAAAENVDVTVALDNGSLLASFNEDFAYTSGKTVYVAKNNKVFSFTETQNFDAFVSVAMNSTHIVALAKKGEKSSLFVYSYSADGISKTTNYSHETLRVEKLDCLQNDEEGNFYALDENYVSEFKVNSETFIDTPNVSLKGLFAGVDKFALIKKQSDKILYLIVDGDLYEIKKPHLDDEESLDEFLVRSGDFTDLTVADNTLICIDRSGAYAFNSQDKTLLPLLDTGVGEHSKICASFNALASKHWVYVKSDLNAVNVYEYDGAFNYYGSFDRTKYSHPQEFDNIKVYRTTSSVTLYSSPRHLQTLTTLPADEYILILAESGDFYYAYAYDAASEKAIFGYIKKQADVTLCPANTSPSIGLYAQPLHPDVPIYKYPFGANENNTALRYSTIYDQLVVVDNVGEDGDFAWGWYKVGYTDSENNVVYGYIRALNVSPYTQLQAPDLSKTAKLTEQKLGEYIKIYSLPNEKSALAGEVGEGTQVYLKNKFDKNSEWTAIIYDGKTAYVKTANVQPEGLTSWQIALAITLPIVALAIAAATVILVVVRKRKLAYKA